MPCPRDQWHDHADFIVDSGAAEVNIPADVVMTLIRANAIVPSDFLPGRTYVLADGTRVQSPRFMIRRSASAVSSWRTSRPRSAKSTGSLLLGQSVLERLGQWSLDTGRGVMVLGEAGSIAESAARVPHARPKAATTGCRHLRAARWGLCDSTTRTSRAGTAMVPAHSGRCAASKDGCSA